MRMLRWAAYAKEKGLQVPINTDAHSVEGLGDMQYGVGIARKGGLTAQDVLNAMSVGELLDRLGD